MIQKYFILLGFIVTVTSLAGCAASRLEKDYGNSFRLTKSNQILHPEATMNLEPVYGFDGHAAGATIAKYRMGFEKRDVAPVFILGTIGK
jgi:hypothetical protein